ncbi:strictosidine synthase [Streptomyces griseoflavus]|uniref:SMP-30/gluconolactonase/LRE family protein n=1 Tax=Streptomyces rimosus TaxID=1927 RepID=UPI000519C2CF|nr:SMP-30/gluconolactonase/LRE family protein [Streptomyces rimosus]KOG56313.1 strictosidine synthase [Streptomyces griseoflavus]
MADTQQTNRIPLPMPPLRTVPLDGRGPEDVVVDAVGRVLTGVEDGRVLRLDLFPKGSQGAVAGVPRAEVIARTGGRPLGLEPLPDGGVLVCDARRGLLRVDPSDGTVRTLADTVDGAPLRFCSNATAAADGTVYFSVSSRRYPLEDWLGDILEHSGTGRLVRLRPGGRPEVVLDGLQFANGVALAPDESFVTVAETGSRRLTRLWLTGPRAGQRDVLAGDLPGYPDNMSRGSGGLFWVALAGPRSTSLERLHRGKPALRQAVGSVARHVRPKPGPLTGVLALDASGRIVHDLRRRSPDYRMVTSVHEHDGHLVLGSLHERALAVCAFPSASRG